MALLLCVPSFSACNRRSGCPAYESLHNKTNSKGELSKKSGNTHLFPKKMRKKM